MRFTNTRTVVSLHSKGGIVLAFMIHKAIAGINANMKTSANKRKGKDRVPAGESEFCPPADST